PGTDLGALGWFAVVWVTMMAAMMLPSLVPMSAVHLRTGRSRDGRLPIVAACVFVLGYLAVWALAGLVAWLGFEAVRSLDVAWLAWDRGGRYLAGGVIVAAALYELTPVKGASLSHCRVPVLLAERWRPGARGALRTGVEHGGFCVGSSWALMAALFALGVMNVAWMVVVAGLVAIEKLLPWERDAGEDQRADEIRPEVGRCLGAQGAELLVAEGDEYEEGARDLEDVGHGGWLARGADGALGAPRCAVDRYGDRCLQA